MHARSTILGFGLLTILLTAGAAQSLSGSNTVFTDDIVDRHVTNADLGTSSVTSSKVAANSLTGSDINEASIPGFKKVQFAKVAASGTTATVVAGDATGAVNSGTGSYLVTFPTDIEACAASVASADPGGGPPGTTTSSGVFGSVFAINGAQAQVIMRQPSGAGLNTSFHLVLFCP